MTNYVQTIKDKNIGGKNFDSQWVYRTEDYGALATAFTLPAHGSRGFDLSNILPNDNYTYMCNFDVYIRTGTANNSVCGCALFVGNGADKDTQLFAQLDQVVTRTSGDIAGGGNCIIPIPPDNRYITFFDNGGVNTTGNCGIYLKRYKRVGTNE